jgi:hypothetical protein
MAELPKEKPLVCPAILFLGAHNIGHKGTQTRILMNAKCRMKNVKVKMQKYKIMA